MNEEVGTWDLTDPQNSKFTAAVGLWDGTWQGLWQPDGSYQIRILGRGTGGAVDGLELIETATGGPGPLEDLSIPINYTGIVGPAGALNAEVLDDFDDGNVSNWWDLYSGKGTVQLIPASQQLTVRGNWRGIKTITEADTSAAARRQRSWKVEDGQTTELRVDVVGFSETTRQANLWFSDLDAAYAVCLFKEGFVFYKWVGGRRTVFPGDFVALKTSRVVLAFALTAAGDNLILTGRVFDKEG